MPDIWFRKFEANPLVCDCHIVWLSRWLRHQEIPYYVSEPPVCHSPPWHAGKRVDEVDLRQLTCGRKRYRKISNIKRIKSQNLKTLISFCNCLCPIHWSQLLSREWRCSWSSADRRCSNYIWVINSFIAQSGGYYIRCLTVNINFALLASYCPKL